MTTDHVDETSATRSGEKHHRPRTNRDSTVLQAVGSQIRRDPRLLVPFVSAGVLLMLADVLRTEDPIPAATPDVFGETISVQYSVYPTGTARTVRTIGALVDLQTPYLLWSVGIELLVVLGIALAGWVTISRAFGIRRRFGSLLRYLGLVVALGFVPRLFGSPAIDVDSLLLGIGIVIVGLLVFVRLYLVPAFLMAGRGFVPAVRESAAVSRGQGRTLVGLILLLGIASWGLAHVPIAGAFLSTAIVAPVQAVSYTAFVQPERLSPD